MSPSPPAPPPAAPPGRRGTGLPCLLWRRGRGGSPGASGRRSSRQGPRGRWGSAKGNNFKLFFLKKREITYGNGVRVDGDVELQDLDCLDKLLQALLHDYPGREEQKLIKLLYGQCSAFSTHSFSFLTMSSSRFGSPQLLRRTLAGSPPCLLLAMKASCSESMQLRSSTTELGGERKSTIQTSTVLPLRGARQPNRKRLFFKIINHNCFTFLWGNNFTLKKYFYWRLTSCMTVRLAP